MFDDVAHASRRSSFQHAAFRQPSTRAAKIWRYSDLAKLTSVLHRRSLFFSRSDLLGDPWEGSFSFGSSAAFTPIEEKAKLGGPEAAQKDWRTAWEEMFERARWCMHVSTWQIREHDVPAMWERYCGGDLGVAIQSTYARLDLALPQTFEARPIMLGLVAYGDYRSLEYQIDVSNTFSPLCLSESSTPTSKKSVRYSTISGLTAPMPLSAISFLSTSKRLSSKL